MKVGLANIIITPDLEKRRKPLQLAGYSPRKYCTGIYDDLFARAIYIEGTESDKASHILLITCDVLGIDGDLADMVKRAISRAKIPLQSENIVICATHTHHGPDYRGLFSTGGYLGFIKGFLFPHPETEELKIFGKKLIKVAKRAYFNRKKALLGATQTTIPEKDQVVINRRDPFNYSKTLYPLTVIKVISDETEDKGALLGAIVNYACHGTVLPYQNTLMTADYVGYIINTLKGKYPDVKEGFSYFNGPCGEINPLTRELALKMKKWGPNRVRNTDIYQQKGTFNDAQFIGKVIAKHVMRVLDAIDCKEIHDFKIIEERIKIPVKDYDHGTDIKSALRRLFFRRKLKLFAMLHKIGILKMNIFSNLDQTRLKLGGNLNSSIQVVSIGDLLIATVPGEYFLELGNEVINHAKSLFPSSYPFIVELANDSIGYLYTIEAYMKGGYESSFSIMPLGGRFITMKLKQLIKKLSK